MNLETYQLKTDREEQWALIEQRMKTGSATRKNIRICKDLFFDNVVGGQFRWVDRFWFYHNPTFEGWQHLFDHELTEPLTDQDFRDLNKFLCGDLADYFFCIEDQDYYFKMTFGDSYDPFKTSPLRVNGEKEHRQICLTENVILLTLVNRMSRWLKGKESNEQGLLRFNEKYLDSLLPAVDPISFTAGLDIPKRTKDNSANADIIRSGIETILKFSFLKPASEKDAERSEAAVRITDVLMNHADSLADLTLMHDQAKVAAAKA